MIYLELADDLIEGLLDTRSSPRLEPQAARPRLGALLRMGGRWLAVDDCAGYWALITGAERRSLLDPAGAPPALLAALYRRNLISVRGRRRCPAGLLGEHPPPPFEGRLVEVHLTERCTLACRYCFAGRARRDEALDPDRLLTWIGSLPEGPLTVEFSGGEPLLEAEAVLRLARRLRGVRPVSLALQTNATLVTRALASELAAHGFTVSASLDGSPAQNRSRVSKRGPAADLAARRGIDHLREAGILAGIVSVIDAPQVRDVGSWLEALEATGAGRVKANPLLDRAGRLALDPLLYAAFMTEVARRMMDGETRIREANLSALVEAMSSRLVRYRCLSSRCGLGRTYWVVRPDGRVFPCGSYCAHEDLCLGRLGGDLADPPALRALRRRSPARIPACRRCPWRFFCRGGCSLLARATSGGAMMRSPLCAFYRRLFPFLLEEAARRPAAVASLGRRIVVGGGAGAVRFSTA